MGHYAKLLRATLTALLMLVATAGAAVAGPFEDATAAYELGDYATALHLISTLADRGDADAQFNLGLLYNKGKGVPQNYAEAMIWFRKAAEQGHPVAKLNLGVMYAEGRGVQQDYVRAHMWFNLSAAQGEQKAVKALDMAERRMTPVQIAEAQKLAREWKPTTQPPPR